ncbi:MAG TPA: hypothetical protein VL588_06410 [Bdellovibrionota bacterium]|nr:hypothetical protein [Bdellovibrionota bacterium]
MTGARYAFLTAALLLTACSASKRPVVESARPRGPVPSFDFKRCDSLWLGRNDGVSGDRWSARIEKKPDGWWITASEPNDQLLDRRADGIWVDHFLDEVDTLQVESTPPPGPDSSFGLAQPLWALRGHCGDVTWSLRIGDPSGSAVNGQTPLRFAQADTGPVVAVRGGALALLGRISTFESLRQRWIAATDPDSVYSIEVRSRHQTTFKAERQSGGWVDSRGKTLPAPTTESWLVGFLHLPVEGRSEPQALAKAALKDLSAAPAFDVTLRDRFDHPTHLRVGRVSGAWVVHSSQAPDAVFRTDDRAATLMLHPGQAARN